MKKFFAILMAALALSFAGGVYADEKPAEAPAAAAPAAADAAPAADAPAAEAPAPELNAGDTAWMLTSTMLVILMTIPGLALFYGGLARSKNMLSVLMQVFTVFSLISVLWVVYGYSLAFGGEGDYIAGFEKGFDDGLKNVPVHFMQSDGGLCSVDRYPPYPTSLPHS